MKVIFRRFVLIIVPVALGLGFLPTLIFASAPSETSPSEHKNQGPEVVGAFGVVPGRDLYVHVLVEVPAGRGKAEVVREALSHQGARPLTENFTTTGLVWNQFKDGDPGNNFVTQFYNPANQPLSGAGTALRNSRATWTNVTTSNFAFASGGTTSRCPSMVRECRGPQVYDGSNDVGWLALGGCCTLGVTWYSTTRDEADMVLNTKFPWSTTGGKYDLETVFLHENGHVAGLGHSSVVAAVMYNSYQGIRRVLHTDDINGITALYPQ